jgi:sterol desaturase/sphingolipid hydroxylase (fatty acid hydroxylase superfamily)
MPDVLSAKLIIAFTLAVLWAWESIFPAAPGRAHRLRHAARNFALGGGNVLLTALFTAFLLVVVTEWAEAAQFGLLQQFPASWLTTIVALVLFDGWMYVWHRANHEMPWLWRFHRVHHSDPMLDATSAVRFHMGEIFISGLLRLLVVPLLGLSLHQVLLYDAILLLVILFHHSNIKLPERVDRILRILIATPAIHRVHHSRLMAETNSNYSSIFSGWDRLLRTFRLRADGTPVDFGLDGFDSERQQSLIGLLQMPFTTDSSATKDWLPASPAAAKLSKLR